MSDYPPIQWADSAYNSITGCRRFPPLGEILPVLPEAMNDTDPGIKATSASLKGIYKTLVDDVFQQSEKRKQPCD